MADRQEKKVLGKESWALTKNMFGFFAYNLRMERGTIEEKSSFTLGLKDY